MAATGALHKAAAAAATNLAVATAVVAREEAMADKKAAKASSNGREPDGLFAPAILCLE